MVGSGKNPGESDLHKALKFRYAGPDGETEVTRGSYVCDGISGNGEIIEVQTGSFGPLKEKIKALAAVSPVRIVHPVIISKYIECLDSRGSLLHRRKSPRHGSEWDLFKALVYAPDLPALPALTIELVLLDISECRVRDGQGSWRRRGDRITGKKITAWHKTLELRNLRDYERFLPFKKGERFTAKSLGEKAGIRAELARKTLYVLTRLGLAEKAGKTGNAWIYVRKYVRKGRKKKAESPSASAPRQ